MTRVAGVAELTAHGGRVAGGRLSRREILAQFAPSDRPRGVPAAEQIGLLITTDVLSEGLDLQQAVVVVHVDLPWNPARLEQRVGRVRRLGSRHTQVFVYAFAPPARAERVLRVEQRLRSKLEVASRLVGAGASLLIDQQTELSLAPPEVTSNVFAQLEQWRGRSSSYFDHSVVPCYAAVMSPSEGFLALLAIGDERILLASLDGNAPSYDAALVARAVTLCDGRATLPTPAEHADAIARIRSWSDGWLSRRRVAVSSRIGAQLRAKINSRIAQLIAGAPRHQRAMRASLASRARLALSVTLGAAGERSLARLAAVKTCDEEWLREIAMLAEDRTRRAPDAETEPEPLVVILLRKASP
jgi:hypothetical protein